MANAFTRNYEDNSTEAGHQFTFYCDMNAVPRSRTEAPSHVR